MAAPQQPDIKDLPVVLLLRPFPFISSYTDIFSNKFRSLNPSTSSLPLNQFLTTHANSIRVLICSGFKPLSSETLECLPSLELVITTSTGIDHIDLNYCRSKGIRVANAGDVFTEDVADIAVGLLLSLLRKIPEADGYVRNGFWLSKGEFPLGSKIGGKRVGIVGLGSIGSEVAKRLEAFGCMISYNSRTKKNTVPYLYYPDVRDLAANSDILIISCALTDETYHIINKNVLSALGREGVVVNVGRGALIDEKELVRSLLQREIKGAGLDVFENEPDVPKELLQLDNVVLSPHKAVLTPESFSALHELLIANLEAFFFNKPLLSSVNLE
ncbi:Glyoxylate/hydroxypyruvate reductase B [Thalictrum thalictroides]|uniref:Glyoxylate/hydroxypyruvate reductase B n=1 Tax=Thalictrum thalictroides TaxID=46969 RepID=A0A7J6VDF2_THATH|nr:Glyoxylate/hydroxypyruvate reductase B [Thalictrum thalictroides]